MRRLTLIGGIAGVVIAASPLAAQQSSPLYFQGSIGGVSRADGDASFGSRTGFFLLARGGVRAARNLGVVTEISVSQFGTATIPVAQCGLCTQPGANNTAASMQGIGLVGFAAGLQPQVKLGAVTLMGSATIGGYLPYHAPTFFFQVKPAVHSTLGLGLPVGGRFQALLEIGNTQFLTSSARALNGWTYNLGFAIN